MSKDESWEKSVKPRPEETSGAVAVLFPTIKDYRYQNETQSPFDFFRPGKPEINVKLIGDTIMKQFQDDKSQGLSPSYEVYLSLNEAIKEIAKRDSDSSFGDCCLTLISLPADAVSFGTDMVTDESGYTLNDDATIENFQLQYSLIIQSKEDFAARRFTYIVHPPYQALYDLISRPQPDIKSVLEEIEGVYKRIRPDVLEENQFLKLLRTLSYRDLFSIYKSLNDYPFTDKQDTVLAQCILNIMAFSPEFCKQAPLMMENYKNTLSFSTLLPGLPEVVHDIIFQYHAIEETDIQERRACIY
jgi:hypothetical protein